MMFGYYPEPEDPPEIEVPSNRVFACIYRRGGQTFCGRMVPANEYTFSSEGAEHEIAHYDPRTMPKTATPHLSACTECIDKAKEIIAKEGISRTS